MRAVLGRGAGRKSSGLNGRDGLRAHARPRRKRSAFPVHRPRGGVCWRAALRVVAISRISERLVPMNSEPLETLEGSEYPCCRQLSVFLENRLGQLLRVTRLLESEPVFILGMAVEGTIDCAILRLLVNDPDRARQLFSDHRFAVSESELLLVELPPGPRGIMTVCAALITGEININYVYTVWPSEEHGPCLAIQVDQPGSAVQVLKQKKFRVLDQSEL
jgi:hypothetical protein